MALERLKFVTDKVVGDLFSSIEYNVSLYKSGSFKELSKEPGWSVETKGVTYDPDFASKLVPSNEPKYEVQNSLLVLDSLDGMTPALAREERIWVRLCHIECLEYARGRWLKSKDTVRDVRKHFFASRLDEARDDNAVGRLWWNAYLARLIDPSDPKRVLNQVLKRA